MAALNWYELLKVKPDASDAEIEDAYDRLFDRYEEKASAGDARAVAVLECLNQAHETLMDPASRANFDKSLGSGGTQQTEPPPQKTGATARPGGSNAPIQQTQRSAVRSERGALAPPESLIVRRRAAARPRAVQPEESSSSPVPYIAILVLGIALLASLIYLLTRGPSAVPEAPRGNVVATVNGVPIYEREFEERVKKDKAAALADPFVQLAINNFQGITGTRALDIVRYDALDKLINLEVIQQQAKKENKYPGPEQQATIISEAKTNELRPGETFDAFLRRVGVSEAQYNQRVIENFVYVLMAEENMPKSGDNDSRTEGFLKWICDTRQNYDARVMLTFTVQENKPCTSGLPNDLPLPGLTEQTPVPEPVQTHAAPAAPAKSPSPTGP